MVRRLLSFLLILWFHNSFMLVQHGRVGLYNASTQKAQYRVRGGGGKDCDEVEWLGGYYCS